MMKIEMFGKSCVFGFRGWKFRLHCTRAERIKRFDDLIFRKHPGDDRKMMAKAYFKNGYSVSIVPFHEDGKTYFNLYISKIGLQEDKQSELRYQNASYCSKDQVEAVMEYYQTKRS